MALRGTYESPLCQFCEPILLQRLGQTSHGVVVEPAYGVGDLPQLEDRATRRRQRHWDDFHFLGKPSANSAPTKHLPSLFSDWSSWLH